MHFTEFLFNFFDFYTYKKAYAFCNLHILFSLSEFTSLYNFAYYLFTSERVCLKWNIKATFLSLCLKKMVSLIHNAWYIFTISCLQDFQWIWWFNPLFWIDKKFLLLDGNLICDSQFSLLRNFQLEILKNRRNAIYFIQSYYQTLLKVENECMCNLFIFQNMK